MARPHYQDAWRDDIDGHDDDDGHDLHASEDRHPILGLWAAALFNLCALILPLGGAYAVLLVQGQRLYNYEATPQTAGAAREALDRLARRLAPREGDAREFWDDRVAAALFESDAAAARGALLLGPAILQRSELAAGSDAAQEERLLAELNPATRARYRATVPLGAFTATAPRAAANERFVIVGDARSVREAAEAVINRGARDVSPLLLAGLAAGHAGVLSEETRAGVSVLQAAQTGERLSPALAERLAVLARETLSPTRYAAEARARLSAGADEGQALAAAFRASLNQAELGLFDRLLRQIGAIGVALGPGPALIVLPHAETEEDVARLLLLARTHPERTLALARVATPAARLADAGRGALDLTPELTLALAIVGLAMLGLAAAALTTATQALLGALHRSWLGDGSNFAPSRLARL